MYEVLRGAVYYNGMSDRLLKGDRFSKDTLPAAQLKAMIEDGRVGEVVEEAPEEESQEPCATKGKWCHEPASLAGKSLEELLVMVIATDPDQATDELDSEAAAIALLTSQYDERFQEPLASSEDRTTAGSESGAQSDLDKAREAAQGDQPADSQEG